MKRKRRSKERINVEMVEAARGLWVRYGGREHERIAREMKEAGWAFYRGMLYTRRVGRGTVVGWPERFGWDFQLRNAECGLRNGEEELRNADCGLRNEEENHPVGEAPPPLLKPGGEQGPPPIIRKAGSYKRRRNAGRNEFERWLVDTQTTEQMIWKWDYQRYIYERLAAVTAGREKRLMIFMPPRHGKSELVTIRYVAWRIMQNPKLNVILGSHTQRLADKFSRRIKRVVDEGIFTAETQRRREEAKENSGCLGLSEIREPPDGRARSLSLPVLTKRLNTAAEWETVGGGVVRSVGVGAGIAGFGAGLIVIDDPVRNRADAESRNNREKVDEWFKNDIYTRMEPDAAIILISTRWHEDDLAGRLLKEAEEEGGERWEVISLPAIAEDSQLRNADCGLRNEEKDRTTKSHENSRTDAGSQNPHSTIRNPQSKDVLGRRPGEALCPARYPVKLLERNRRKLGAYAFAALYQQRPEPLEGGQFKRAWFSRVIDYVPAGLKWKRGYDLAVSTKTSADYTASFRVATDKAGILYIADGFRKRIEYPEQRRYIIERMKSEDATEHGVEAAMHGKAVVQELRRVAELRRFALREVKVTADKLTRALAWLNLAEEGKVVLVRGPWIREFVDEVAAFPTGRHDDQIDAVSTAVNMIDGQNRKAYGF